MASSNHRTEATGNCSNAIKRPARRRKLAEDGGQSLLETALFLPLLVLLVAFAVDFGYMFIVAANLSSASRAAAEYSVQGYETPGQATMPAAGPISIVTSVSALAVGDLSGLVSASTTTTVQVCSKEIGVTNSVAQCAGYGPVGTSYTPGTDPEAPTFVLNRVDVTYTVQPPIPLSFFSHPLVPSLKFHRQVSMRALD
ncbi:MAG: TadE/TadG family type IV pilus assembly protein [Acidobacteriaceae bacterium]